jgi:hypothetical protein
MADGGSTLSNKPTPNNDIFPGKGAMGMKASPFWQANDPILVRLAAEGHMTASAALELGITKSAVIGRAYRTGVKWDRSSGPTKITEPPKPLQAAFPGHGKCVFPQGHPGEEGFSFCGDRVADVGRPYCVSHMKVCYTGLAPAPRNLTDAQRAEKVRIGRANMEKRLGRSVT